MCSVPLLTFFPPFNSLFPLFNCTNLHSGTKSKTEVDVQSKLLTLTHWPWDVHSCPRVIQGKGKQDTRPGNSSDFALVLPRSKAVTKTDR